MQALPHEYCVMASGAADGDVILSAAGLPPLETGPPPQFGGRADQWSPETLLVAAAADCFVLTFRAIARASNLPWTTLRCRAEGRLDRVDAVPRFTHIALNVRLTVPGGIDIAKARRLLEKTEKGCLITNSLVVAPTLTCEIATVPGAEASVGAF